MKFSKPKETFGEAIIVTYLGALILFSCGCSGKLKKTTNGTEIFYDGITVTEADVDRLGEILTETGFSGDNEVTAELAKEGDVWQFRMATIEGAEDQPRLFSLMCLELSNGFDGQPFVIDLCDEFLISKKKIYGPKGTLHKVGEANVYLDGVSEDILQPLHQLIEEKGIKGVIIHIRNIEGDIKVRYMAADELLTAGAQTQTLKLYTNNLADKMAEKVFEGQRISFSMCNQFFEDRLTVLSR